MTEVFINGKLVDIEDEQLITASYGNLSFGNFASRRGVKTNNYKLPITNNNKLILENSDQVASGSNIPYRFSEISVVVDGLEVFSGLASIDQSQDYFELICISGLSNFYAFIKDKYLTDIDLSEFDHVYNQISIVNSFTRTTGYTYAYCSYGQWNYIFDAYPIDPTAAKPQIFFHTVVRSIFKDAGYTLQGNVMDNVRLRNHMILYNRFPSKMVYGESFSLASTLPDKVKQSALILDFLNIYGVMLDVNEYDKIVTANFIDDIIFKTPVDWSDKIDDTERPKIAHAFDYGQENTIAYKTDDDYPGDLASTFEIENETLPLTDTIYTSGFYCFIDNQDTGLGVADTTRTFTQKEESQQVKGMWQSAETYFADDVVFYQGTWYLCILYPGGSGVLPTNTTYFTPKKESDIWTYKVRPMYGALDVINTGYRISFNSSDVPFIKMITGKNMDWAYTIANHYEVFKRTLDKTKIVEHLFKLSYSDINQLDLTRPVWLDRYDNLFIIDEIEQFKLNDTDSTNVRLIRL